MALTMEQVAERMRRAYGAMGLSAQAAGDAFATLGSAIGQLTAPLGQLVDQLPQVEPHSYVQTETWTTSSAPQDASGAGGYLLPPGVAQQLMSDVPWVGTVTGQWEGTVHLEESAGGWTPQVAKAPRRPRRPRAPKVPDTGGRAIKLGGTL